MEPYLQQFRIRVHEGLFLKDPDSTPLGRTIVQESIELIEELGFEGFTFKKLGTRIGSPESTIYRYFENKHKLLVYLISWYWAWQEYRMMFATANIEDASLKLHKALLSLTEAVQQDSDIQYINEEKLYQIVVAESSKAYFTKDVDADNKEGYFMGLKRLVRRVADMVRDVNPDYPYPSALITAVVEGAHQQRFFAQHLPSLSEAGKKAETLTDFFVQLVFRTITPQGEDFSRE
ncbi:TetR/AcrR family transcriptional regulator [Cesiribacter andamanensis]|uniref:Bacterial regulatory protein n=1 Tax=Cesiribacter andamanensis AMV16 TaxID=1279009 RepID=M7NKN5_9BACT|nr:TetR/AcrR family transcriptional regulator [Cesiribacter andamanensis]EMR02335.1 Bacterial regulatory protein [Cesiribacter andamanensis AMV16]